MSEIAQTSASLLTGPKKAAALLLAMDKTTSSALMRRFSYEEQRTVTMAAARLGAVHAEELDALIEEFAAALAAGAPLLGDENQARALIADAATPDQISEILADLEGFRDGDVWVAVGNLPESLLAGFLREEHPLTASFILSRLDAALTARIVAQLPRDQRNEVLVRLLSPPTVSPAALNIIETALRESLLGSAGGTGDDNRARIAEIINNLGPLEAEEAMQAMSAARPQDARVVRTMLFAFNDLPRLKLRARALLFDKLSTEVVVSALRGCDHEFRESVLSAMASRSRRLVESELANPTQAPASETEKARRQIIKMVLVMAQRGEIELPSSDEPDAA